MVALLVSALGACNAEQPKSGGEIVLETEDDRTIYAMGFNLASKFDQLPLSKSDREILQAGFDDAVNGRDPQVDTVRYGRRVEELFARRGANTTEANRDVEEAFLVEAAAEQGARRTDSGVVMKELRPGDGPSPGPDDRVRVHYHGTLHDGTVFDSSVDRGQPASFSLNRVIPCWTEALQLMKVGGKSRIVCPAEIAYGDQGAPPLVKPGATLAFEVELLSILR
jgi:FKBP-type peptidyl-prolyl cis-trans isomerase FkpA/FKBP-type peptidyl-prolyl cis-trans isomerase FklB